MEELEKYLNHHYLERDNEYIFVYKFVKVNNQYGFICHEVQVRPDTVYVYDDFPEDQEGSIGFIKSFIPELDDTCIAKEISEGHYYELVSQIEKLNILQNEFQKKVREFVKDGLEKEV